MSKDEFDDEMPRLSIPFQEGWDSMLQAMIEKQDNPDGKPIPPVSYTSFNMPHNQAIQIAYLSFPIVITRLETMGLENPRGEEAVKLLATTVLRALLPTVKRVEAILTSLEEPVSPKPAPVAPGDPPRPKTPPKDQWPQGYERPVDYR